MRAAAASKGNGSTAAVGLAVATAGSAAAACDCKRTLVPDMNRSMSATDKNSVSCCMLNSQATSESQLHTIMRIWGVTCSPGTPNCSRKLQCGASSCSNASSFLQRATLQYQRACSSVRRCRKRPLVCIARAASTAGAPDHLHQLLLLCCCSQCWMLIFAVKPVPLLGPAVLVSHS